MFQSEQMQGGGRRDKCACFHADRDNSRWFDYQREFIWAGSESGRSDCHNK